MGRLQQVVLGAPSSLAAGNPQAALESLVAHFNQLQGAWQQMQSQQASPPLQPQVPAQVPGQDQVGNHAG
eukprot:1048986-Pyramimonas_sp.AAC.1